MSSFCLNFKLFCQPDLGRAKLGEKGLGAYKIGEILGQKGIKMERKAPKYQAGL